MRVQRNKKKQKGRTNMKYGICLIMVMSMVSGEALIAPSALAAETIPEAYWSFDEGTNYAITGYVTNVPGVQGSALTFDGFTSRVTPSTNVFISITNGFSVQCWIAPQEYSWNWTGLVDQEKEHKEGFSFGINHVGHVGLCLAINGEWQSFLSKEPPPSFSP
jgi:hypothetical protein